MQELNPSQRTLKAIISTHSYKIQITSGKINVLESTNIETIIPIRYLLFYRTKIIEFYEFPEDRIKENCKTGLSRQVGKTSIFPKEALVVIQDKMRERCVNGFNIAYGMDSKLKEKQKGKNRDITSYERKLFHERVKGLKQEISNLENEVSDLEDNKESISKQITQLSKDIDDIKDEIDKKKKLIIKLLLNL